MKKQTYVRNAILLICFAVFFGSANAQPTEALDFDNITCYDVNVVVFAVDNTQTVVGQTQVLTIPGNGTKMLYCADPGCTKVPWSGGSAPSGQWSWGYATVTVSGGCSTGGSGNCPQVGTTTSGVCCGYNFVSCYDNPAGCVLPNCLPGLDTWVTFTLNNPDFATILIH